MTPFMKNLLEKLICCRGSFFWSFVLRHDPSFVIGHLSFVISDGCPLGVTGVADRFCHPVPLALDHFPQNIFDRVVTLEGDGLPQSFQVWDTAAHVLKTRCIRLFVAHMLDTRGGVRQPHHHISQLSYGYRTVA